MAMLKSHQESCTASFAAAPRLFRLWAGSAACPISADSSKKDIESGESAAPEEEDGRIPTVMVQKKGLRDKSSRDKISPLRAKCVAVFNVSDSVTKREAR